MKTLMTIISTVFGDITRIADTAGESAWMIGDNEYAYVGRKSHTYLDNPGHWVCVTWGIDAPTLRECVGKALALDRSYHCYMWHEQIGGDQFVPGGTNQKVRNNYVYES